MQHSTLTTLFGYDAALLAQLTPASRRQLARIAEGWLLSSILLALPIAYAAWLIEHLFLLAVLAGGATWALVVNMLRLTLAGGGAAPHFAREQVQSYRPALGSSVVLGLLAVLMAQPAQLPLWQDQLAQPIEQHRAALLARHEQSMAALGLADDGSYRAELARCEFAVLRMQLMWRDPTRAAPLTLAFVLLVLLPAWAARLFALEALREYQLLSWRRSRRVIAQGRRETQAAVNALLSAFPGYQPPEPWHSERRRA